MKLATLLEEIADVEKDVAITGLTLDSREVVPGDVFIAISGFRQHGLEHARQAIDRGAVAVVYEISADGEDLIEGLQGIEFIAVQNLAGIIGEIASRFYQYPSKELPVIAITGTNGKTSSSQFLAQIIKDCGVIGTLGWGMPGALKKTINTTPDAISLHGMLKEFVTHQTAAVVMEVSSHALEQGRVNGIRFSGAAFTNISRDHLDYHGSMESYVQAKLALLKKPGLNFVVVNLDDDYCAQIIHATPEGPEIWGFSSQGRTVQKGENVAATNVQQRVDGMEFTVSWRDHQVQVKVSIFGDFNLENVLTVLTTSLAMGLPLVDIVEKLPSIQPVAGRMECVKAKVPAPIVFVDYAHTPDALNKVLAELKEHCKRTLWVVFGCGGGRDRGKRAQMGQVAEKWADRVVVTNDNPRNEFAEEIVADILSGCISTKIEVIQDRKEAINMAIRQAYPEDIILIAGKGHEDYQEINGHRKPFSDVEVAKASLLLKSELQG